MKFSKLLCFVLLAVFVDKCYTCSPGPPMHPQTKFCQAKFAAKVKVIKVEKPKGAMYHKYEVIVRRVFKDDTAAKSLRRGIKQVLYTASDSAACGGYLAIKSTYLVTGYYDNYNRRYKFSSVDWTPIWKGLTGVQKRGVRKLYQSNCDCELVLCDNGICEEKKSTSQCNWVPDAKDCWAENGVCIQKKKGCKWNRKSQNICPKPKPLPSGRPVILH